jgi:hypothetical protein
LNRRLAGSIFAVAAALMLAPHSPIRAQQSPLLSYTNNNGWLQATLSTRVEFDLYAPQSAAPWLIPETTTFVAPRASAFGEVFAGKSIYALTEIRVDRGEVPAARPMQLRIEQLFLRYSAGPALELQGGKFVSPFGGYPQRHANVGEAFIRPPLPYDWPTLVTPGIVPESNNEFIAWKDDPSFFRSVGVPPVWAVPYQVGAMAFGAHRGLSYRIAVMNSAPSSVPAEWNSIRNVVRRPSFVGALGLQITPDLRTGISVNHGPYMREDLASGAAYPAGEYADEFTQTLAGFDATYAREHVELHGEYLFDRWYVPNVIDRPTDYSFYVESKVKFSPGFFVAGRVAQMRFNRVTRSPDNIQTAQETESLWDYPTSRIELGTGYRLTTALSMRAQYQWNIHQRPRDLDDDLLSVQLRFDR